MVTLLSAGDHQGSAVQALRFLPTWNWKRLCVSMCGSPFLPTPTFQEALAFFFLSVSICGLQGPGGSGSRRGKNPARVGR